MKTLKEELLKHYSEKEPRHLTQFDVFTNCETWDSVVSPNSIWKTDTYELMNSPWTVRVLVDSSLKNEELSFALKRILDLIGYPVKEMTGADKFNARVRREMANHIEI